MQYALGLYKQLLRFYPSSFRQLLAEEMLEVFALRIRETQTRRELVRLIVLEMRSLPVGLIREYAAELSRRVVLVPVGGKAMFIQSVGSYRYLFVLSLVFVSLICLLILLPFFAHDLHLEASSSIADGYFDPKGFFPYNSEVGHGLYALGLISLLLLPLWGGIVSLFACLGLWRQWGVLSGRERIIAGLPLSLIILLVAVALSPLGLTAITWFLD